MQEGDRRPTLRGGAAHDTRTRSFDAEGLRWEVHEMPATALDRRSGPSLIFDAGTVVRRVRNYPPDWYDWSDADLYALSLKT